MQISGLTLEILKNFSAINPIFSFDGDGNVIRTKSAGGEIVAFCEIEESLPEMYIYDLRAFLQTISLVGENASFEFNPNGVVINSQVGKRKANFAFCAKELVVPVKKTANIPPADVVVEISKETMNGILTAARTIGVSEIVVRQNGSTLLLCAEAAKNEGNSNSFSIELDAVTTPGNSKSFSFKVDSFKFISAAYTLSISDKGIAEFKTVLGNGKALKYWTPVTVTGQ